MQDRQWDASREAAIDLIAECGIKNALKYARHYHSEFKRLGHAEAEAAMGRVVTQIECRIRAA